MDILQPIIHYGLHFLFPGLIAYLFFRDKWKQVYFICIATMLVDLDHLLTKEIFVSNRCSINFHLLHSYWAIGVYCLLLILNKTRVIAIGLLMHMGTDWVDCQFM